MLNFVTTNPGKVREATEYLDDEVTQFDFDYPEVQADDLKTVAAEGARAAYRAADGPVIVDDAGLFIDAFDGFPGPYSSYVEDTVGVERVWRMTEPEDDRGAAFKTVIAYCDGDGFEATPDPGGVDREDRRGQDLAADDRGAGDDGRAGRCRGWRKEQRDSAGEAVRGARAGRDRRPAWRGRVRLRPHLRARRNDVRGDEHRAEERDLPPRPGVGEVRGVVR